MKSIKFEVERELLDGSALSIYIFLVLMETCIEIENSTISDVLRGNDMAVEGNIAYFKVNKNKIRYLKLLTDFSYPCTGTSQPDT